VNPGERLAAWTWDRGRFIAAVLAAVTALAAWQATRVGVDNSLAVWFVEDDPQLAAYTRFQAQFGNDEVVVVALEEPSGVLVDPGLARLGRAARALRAVDGVSAVLTVDARHFEHAPEDNEVRRRLLAGDALRGGLVSADGTTAALIVRMAAAGAIDKERDAILARIDAALAEAGAPARKAGIGVLFAALNRLSIVDSSVLFCGAFALMFLLLWAILGRALAALAVLGVGGTAALWTLGLYGAAGRSMNMVTSVMPAAVLVVGIAESVHVLLNAATLPAGMRPREKAIASMGFMLKPCALNVLTSAAGFASLAFAPMPAIRDLGLFAAAGLAGCLVLTVAAGSLALHRPQLAPAPGRLALLARCAMSLAAAGTRHPAATLAAVACVTLAAALAASRIEVDTFTLQHLDPSHPVRRDAEAIEARLGPYIPLDFIVRRTDGRVDGELLEAVERWQRAAAGVPGSGRSRSLADDFRAAAGPGPMDAARLAGFLSGYRDSVPAMLDRRLGEDGAVRVTFALRNMSANDAAAAVRAIAAEARLPEGTQAAATGYVPVYVRMVEHIVRSQVAGFALAFATVFGVVALAFRPLGLAALALPANLLPLLAVFAAMGVAGIRLDVATATVASVVLGLVVDDTVHLLHRLRCDLGRTGDPAVAIRETASHAGGAILATALVVGLGFAAFGLAEIRSVAHFGLLIAVAVAASAIVDLLVIPALVTLLAARARRLSRLEART
jgi:predicted RND superfamily exporter protein